MVAGGQNLLLWNGRGERYVAVPATSTGGSGSDVVTMIAPELLGAPAPSPAPEDAGGVLPTSKDTEKDETTPKPSAEGGAGASGVLSPGGGSASSAQRISVEESSAGIIRAAGDPPRKKRKNAKNDGGKIASRHERVCFLVTPLFVWLFIFFAGMTEFMSGLRPACTPGDAEPDVVAALVGGGGGDAPPNKSPRLFGQARIHSLDDTGSEFYPLILSP